MTIYRKNNMKYACILSFLVLGSLVRNGIAAGRKTLFDNDWRFHHGVVTNAVSTGFDDSAWRALDLPHDWSIEPLPNQEPEKVVGPFSRDSIGDFATGQTVGGEGWYRKTFVIPPEDAGLRHELYFEGVYNQSEVWVNGKKVGENVYGYSTFRFDISEYCNPPGQQNTIAVRVLNEGKNSRWYSGSGIYRHVWLIRTPKTHIDDWGTFITTTKLHAERADVSLATTVIGGDGECRVEVELISPKGQTVAQADKKVQTAGAKTEVSFDLSVKNPSRGRRIRPTCTPPGSA